jgi:3-methylcrotonyl-CoA carboxylase beta subunit
MNELARLYAELESQEAALREGGSEAGHERQRKLGRLTARERLARLLDPDAPFLELGLWQAWRMYPQWGDVPAAGVVTGLGRVEGRPVMVIANDATVKAGAFFPQSVKKVLRAQRIAGRFRLPILYLVDSAGVFLPLQDEIFPDEDDFGRIFRNNAVLSAAGIPQYAAVMGNCVAGGAYLPVLCDKLLMTDGSQMYLAGPSLVKAAIGQEVDPEQLGGAAMHAAISGTVDFREADDPTCLRRLRSLVRLLDDPRTDTSPADSESTSPSPSGRAPERDAQDVYRLVTADGRGRYDMRDLLKSIVDADSLQEFKAEYGPTVVTTFARIDGHAVGIVGNQSATCKTANGELQIGGVLYCDSVDKAARFVMDCNQTGLPIVFLQDVQGFMVGKQAEQSGIIRSGAKLVNAVSNSVVPKLTVIVGGSFGAGNYALCGKAYDPWLILAWPGARYAVMGAAQAAATLLDLQVRDATRKGRTLSQRQQQEMRDEIQRSYELQTDIRYAAARGWVDAVIAPHQTRMWLSEALRRIPRVKDPREFRTGVFQV